MAWSTIYSISLIEIHSTALLAVLRTESIIGAVVSVALCIWIVVLLSKRTRNVDAFLAIFLGLFAVALVLAAIPENGIGVLAHVLGVVTLAGALVLPVALIRARLTATASS